MARCRRYVGFHCLLIDLMDAFSIESIRIPRENNSNNNKKLDCLRWYTIVNTRYFTFDIDLGIKFSRNVAKYSIYYVAYVPSKFEVAASNGFRDAFTRK